MYYKKLIARAGGHCSMEDYVVFTSFIIRNRDKIR